MPSTQAAGSHKLTLMSITETPQLRRRRTPEVARQEALAHARDLLLEGGPGAVTLAAVAGRMGVTHANLIHHFGSAAELQSALMSTMVKDLDRALTDAVARLTTDEQAPMDAVNAVFDAFSTGGAGRLAAWIALSGDRSHIAPVREAVRGLVEALDAKLGGKGEVRAGRTSSAVILIGLCALGDSLIGQSMTEMLDHDPDTGRTITADMLTRLLADPGD